MCSKGVDSQYFPVTNKWWTDFGIQTGSTLWVTPLLSGELCKPHHEPSGFFFFFRVWILNLATSSWQVFSHCRHGNYSHCHAWPSSVELVPWSMTVTGCLEDTEWLCLLIPTLRTPVKKKTGLLLEQMSSFNFQLVLESRGDGKAVLCSMCVTSVRFACT